MSLIYLLSDRGRSGGSGGARQKTLSTEEAASLTGNSLVLPVQPNDRRRQAGALARASGHASSSSQGWKYEQVTFGFSRCITSILLKEKLYVTRLKSMTSNAYVKGAAGRESGIQEVEGEEEAVRHANRG